MPHLKVKKFDTTLLDQLINANAEFLFRAKHRHSDNELVGVVHNNTEFMIEVKHKGDAMLLKPDPISRPVDSSKIKKILALLKDKLDLKILHSNIALSTTKQKIDTNAQRDISDFINPVFTRKNIAIEIGFGSGRHLLHQAKDNPETLFIGVEIHTPSIQQVLKQISLQGLDNIWVLNYDARLLLEMIPSNLCSDIFVHFPVPWDKKEHRRVISYSFVQESLRVLRPDGQLELRTDSLNYYNYSKDVFHQASPATITIEKNEDIAVVSKYEERWLAKQKDIYTLRILSKEFSPESNRSYSFEFDRLSQVDKLFLEAMPKKPFVFEDCFVHFEGQYDICHSKEMLIRCAFGNFSKPEHKYLRIGVEGGYYPDNPVPSSSNYSAHTKIGEMIYV